jgi:hypothetical protein
VRVEKKESYWARGRRVEAGLIGFGVSSGLAKKLIYSYPLGLLERLIKATDERQPGKPAPYLLNGLKKARVKQGLQRGPIADEDID